MFVQDMHWLYWRRGETLCWFNWRRVGSLHWFNWRKDHCTGHYLLEGRWALLRISGTGFCRLVASLTTGQHIVMYILETTSKYSVADSATSSVTSGSLPLQAGYLWSTSGPTAPPAPTVEQNNHSALCTNNQHSEAVLQGARNTTRIKF